MPLVALLWSFVYLKYDSLVIHYSYYVVMIYLLYVQVKVIKELDDEDYLEKVNKYEKVKGQWNE